ncbi:MAG: nucleotidyltransferase family protein [bacterium]|nr:nucleotidyltransferase family protein [bacterium]
MDTRDIDVVILCGGLGKRLQVVVNDRPKPMAEINGCPFLDVLIEYIAGYGFRRFILCIGYMGDIIKQHYQKNSGPLTILFSEEKEPLGTAGAIKNAECFIKSNPFLVMNGDSFCPVELDKFVDYHIAKKTLTTIALTKIEENKDYGLVTINSSDRIISFTEKTEVDNNSELVNAGVYLFQKDVLSLIPANRNYSLEYNLFPTITEKRIYGYITKGNFIDIGTPERLEKAKQILAKFKF